MPVPNELTPEDEAEFAQHGIPSPGPGREPLSESNEQPAANEQQGQQQGQEQQGGRQTAHRENGQFASRQEREQGQARPGQSRQQNQQQDQGQGQDQQQQQGQEGQGQEGEGEQRMVPLAALHQERQRLAQISRRAQLAETRLNAILTQRAPAETGAEQMPDINQDPAGYVVALEQRLAKFEQERQQDTQFRQIDSSIEADEDTFASTTPDYHQASDYYVKSRAQELLQFYPPDEAQRLMLQEARQLAQEAWRRGRSIGETIYNLAQARGYNTGMPSREPYQQNGQEQQQGQQQQNGQGQQRGQQSNGMARVASVNRGQQASRSLSGGGAGSANTEQLNADALLSMSDEEFAEYLALGEKGANQRFAAIG